MQAEPTLRPLVRGDLGRLVELLEQTNLGGAATNLARYVTWQPTCGWVAEHDGALVGSVTVLRQGEVGFVGAMAIAPARQGQGLGRRILEHAQAAMRARGVRSFLLEATAAGEPMYERMGYVAIGDTLIAERTATAPVTMVPLADPDRDAILAFDRDATGLERADVIGGLLAERVVGALVHPGEVQVRTTVRQLGEPLAGYGCVVGTRLGPVIARDVAAGRALVAALVASTTVVAIPLENRDALRACTDHGFAATRTLRRMALDFATPPGRSMVWALSSPGAG